jgi:hypothetical protein
MQYHVDIPQAHGSKYELNVSDYYYTLYSTTLRTDHACVVNDDAHDSVFMSTIVYCSAHTHKMRTTKQCIRVLHHTPV